MKPYSKIAAAVASVVMITSPALAASGQAKPRMGAVMAPAKASTQKSNLQPAQTNVSGSQLRGPRGIPPGILIAAGVAGAVGLAVAIAAITDDNDRSVSR